MKNNTPKKTSSQAAKGAAQPNTQEYKAIAALSYFNVLCFVALFLKRDDALVQFHAKQGIALFIIEIIAMLLTTTFFLAWLASVIFMGCIILSIAGIYYALHGQMKALPIIQDMVKKLNL